MQSLDWDNVRHFLEVVRSGSVRQASLQLGVNQTTVSRRISALEDQLGNKLFDRSVNGWMNRRRMADLSPIGALVSSAAWRSIPPPHRPARSRH